jgi:predicted acetyltransferase
MDAPLDPGILRDGELELRLAEFAPHPALQAPAYFFRMVNASTGEDLGRINLRIESTVEILLYGGHAGYEVHPPYRGRRYAERAVRLLMPLAQALGIDPLWITCDPENLASRRTLELAGAEFVEVVDVPEESTIHRNGHPRKCRYRLKTSTQEYRPS